MWGRSPKSLYWRQLGSHGVVPAVDVHQLAGGHVEVVGKQGHDCAAYRGPVLKVPAQGCTHAPYLFEILESRYPTCRQRGKRTCANGVDSDLVTAKIAREITSHRLEGRFGNAHPVVFRPGLRRIVEIQSYQ